MCKKYTAASMFLFSGRGLYFEPVYEVGGKPGAYLAGAGVDGGLDAVVEVNAVDVLLFFEQADVDVEAEPVGAERKGGAGHYSCGSMPFMFFVVGIQGIEGI